MSNRNITVNVPAEKYAQFERLCGLSGASKNEYGNALFDYAIAHTLIAGENFAEAEARLAGIKAGITPLPKVTLQIKAGPPRSIDDEVTPLAAETATPYSRKKSLLQSAAEKLKRSGAKNLEAGETDLRRAAQAEGHRDEQTA